MPISDVEQHMNFPKKKVKLAHLKDPSLIWDCWATEDIGHGCFWTFWKSIKAIFQSRFASSWCSFQEKKKNYWLCGFNCCCILFEIIRDVFGHSLHPHACTCVYVWNSCIVTVSYSSISKGGQRKSVIKQIEKNNLIMSFVTLYLN